MSSTKTYRVTFIMKTGGRKSGGTIDAPAWWSVQQVERRALMSSGNRLRVRDVEVECIKATKEVSDDSEEAIGDALMEHLSPDAIAVIASCLQIADNYRGADRAQAIQEVAWFRELCTKLSAGLKD